MVQSLAGAYVLQVYRPLLALKICCTSGVFFSSFPDRSVSAWEESLAGDAGFFIFRRFFVEFIVPELRLDTVIFILCESHRVPSSLSQPVC